MRCISVILIAAVLTGCQLNDEKSAPAFADFRYRVFEIPFSVVDEVIPLENRKQIADSTYLSANATPKDLAGVKPTKVCKFTSSVPRHMRERREPELPHMPTQKLRTAPSLSVHIPYSNSVSQATLHWLPYNASQSALSCIFHKPTITFNITD